jgi:hypothetical protein
MAIVKLGKGNDACIRPASSCNLEAFIDIACAPPRRRRYLNIARPPQAVGCVVVLGVGQFALPGS